MSSPSMIPLLEGADVELDQARRGYRGLRRAVRRHRFPEPPAQQLTKLDVAVASTAVRTSKARARLTPDQCRTIDRLEANVERERRRLEAIALRAARRNLVDTAAPLPELLGDLASIPPMPSPVGRFELRVAALVLALPGLIWFPWVYVSSAAVLLATTLIPVPAIRRVLTGFVVATMLTLGALVLLFSTVNFC